MKMHNIIDEEFDLKRAVVEQKIFPTEVVDATVWMCKGQLEIRMNKVLESNLLLDDVIIFFWDYFNKIPIAVSIPEIIGKKIYLQVDENLKDLMVQMNVDSVRIAIACRHENKYFCGYFRNITVKEQELTLDERLIGKLTIDDDYKQAFIVYWTEGGILSGRFDKIKNFDDVFYKMKLSGYYWDDGILNCYMETAAIVGTADFALISVNETKKFEQAIIDYADCGFNDIHRLYKVQIDLTHLEDYQKEKGEYTLEYYCGGQKFVAVITDSTAETDLDTVILNKNEKEILLGTDKDEEGRFIIRVGKKQRLFSIIMSIYNVEPYIEEAIESVMSQDIGFLKNVQLIFVNDGSTDRSGLICEHYASNYPDNIIYIEKENGGLSSARNVGLEYVQGKYVNFFDPDDILESNVLSEVAKFFEQNENYIDMVCVPLVYFEAQTGLHGKYTFLGSKNKIVSLAKEPHNFILSAASSFYKSKVFENIRFDEKLLIEEDTKVNFLILKRTLKFGYVCENGVKYNYRSRMNGDSRVDLASSGKNDKTLVSAICIFEELFEMDDCLALYEKELIAYELCSCLRDIKKSAFIENEYQAIMQSFQKWIGKLDDAFIGTSKWLDTIDKKVLFLNLSGRRFGSWFRKGFSDISDRIIRIRYFFIEDEYVHIYCLFNNFRENGIDLVLLSNNGKSKIIFAENAMDIDGPYNLVIGEFCVDFTHVRHYTFPLENSEYVFAYYDAYNNSFAPVRRVHIYGKTRCAANMKGIGPVRNGYCVSIWSNNIVITDDEKITDRVTQTLQKSIKKELPLRHLANDEKKYILISDRPEKAGDNGEALFEYIMENAEQDIKNVTFFVINKKCKDYKRMNYRDHIIDFRSVEHLYMFLNAKVIYSSHNAIKFYYPFPEEEYKYYADLLNYKFVWLQHGITINDVAKAANKLNTLDDAVITSSYREYDEILRDCYLFQKNEVMLTGFARFDKLYDNRENLITIAPTWRRNLVGRILSDGHNEAKNNFKVSEFYLNYMKLLMNNRLRETLFRYGYRIEFVLHSGFSCYEHLFDSVNSQYIHLVKMDDFSYRDAFSKSSLFITDYSSTTFDFAYLKKPIIYFQFDEEEFFSEHYGKGYFNYREDGFGLVLESVDEVVDKIIAYLKSGCEMEKVYKDRVDKTFAHIDHNNCKRILDATRKWII